MLPNFMSKIIDLHFIQLNVKQPYFIHKPAPIVSFSRIIMPDTNFHWLAKV